MKQNERKIFIDAIERLIKAYECGETKLPGDRCEHCPYGFGYLDDHGDHEYWWCNDDKIEEMAMKLLFILKEKI